MIALRVSHGDAELRQPSARGGAAVARDPRELHCLAGGSGPAQKLSVALERTGEVDEYRRSLGVGSQGRRALEQPRGGGFLAGGRATSGAREAGRRSCGHAGRRRLARAELATQDDGALEVVAEQLIERRKIRPVLLEPVGKALVQHGARVPSESRRMPRRG